MRSEWMCIWIESSGSYCEKITKKILHKKARDFCFISRGIWSFQGGFSTMVGVLDVIRIHSFAYYTILIYFCQPTFLKKIRWINSRLDFLGSRRNLPYWLPSKRVKLSTRSITHFCWCNWRKNANAAGRSPMGSCSCTTMPRFTGHLHPRRNWPTWASNVLITHPILRIWPRRTTTCSLDWRNNWKVAIFLPTRRSLLPRRPGWTDDILNSFWVACKS